MEIKILSRNNKKGYADTASYGCTGTRLFFSSDPWESSSTTGLSSYKKYMGKQDRGKPVSVSGLEDALVVAENHSIA